MTPKFTRDDLIAQLSSAFTEPDWVCAAWLGGSDASGRTDEHSDIDFQVIVEDEAVERCFELLHACLEELAPVELSHRLPEPCWHGFSQEFLRVADTQPDHFIDFVAMRASTPPERRLLEVERHGTPLVVLDRGGWLDVPGLDWSAHGARLRARLETLRTTFELYQPLVSRSVARGLPVEAIGFYQWFTLRPLVELLRMRQCPERFDFGLRYLDRDLDAETYALVQRLAYPRDAGECEALRGDAATRFRAELEALERGDWGIRDS